MLPPVCMVPNLVPIFLVPFLVFRGKIEKMAYSHQEVPMLMPTSGLSSADGRLDLTQHPTGDPFG